MSELEYPSHMQDICKHCGFIKGLHSINYECPTRGADGQAWVDTSEGGVNTIFEKVEDNDTDAS